MLNILGNSDRMTFLSRMSIYHIIFIKILSKTFQFKNNMGLSQTREVNIP